MCRHLIRQLKDGAIWKYHRKKLQVEGERGRGGKDGEKRTEGKFGEGRMKEEACRILLLQKGFPVTANLCRANEVVRSSIAFL